MTQKFASLKLAVNHNELKLVKNIMATERTIHGLIVNFDFRTPEWYELTKTAVFIRDGKSYTVLLDAVDECFIPWECLESKGTFTVGVFGVSETTQLPTNVLEFSVAESCVCTGQKPADPTPELYEQVLKLCSETKQLAQSVRDDADAGKFNGTTPHLSLDSNGNLYVKYPDDELSTLLGNIKGEPGDTGRSIENIAFKRADDELIYIEVAYDDNTYHTFSFPRGAKGDPGLPGAGISNIVTTPDTINRCTSVTINMDNGESYNFSIPDGEDGKSIESMGYYDTDSEGNIGIEVFYTDGTIGFIWIPGLKGEDGVGIDDIYTTIDDNTNTTVVCIVLTNGEIESFEIPNGIGEDGADGVGISSIHTIDYLERTEICINLTDGQSTTFSVYNGYTPVKGIDYWTPSDIAEIKSYVDEAILGGAW